MTDYLIQRKYALIQEIMQLNKVDDLILMERQVATIKSREAFWKAAKPMRKNVTLEQIMKEQNYQPVDEKTFFEKAAAVQVEEPIEDLLAMLTP
jgi:hypothetical protein